MSKEVAVKAADYQVLTRPAAEVRDLVATNMGTAGGVTQFDLDRVKVPAGGGLTWTIPTLEGEEETKELEGIIVHWRDTRAYWKDKFGAGGGTSPPQCSSRDGIHGEGDPGGDCASCKFSQWKSQEGSNGQACKSIRLVFLLRPGSLMPLVLPLPPTSIGNTKKFFLRLAGAGVPVYGVVTKWKLERATNAASIAYAKATPSLGRKLTPDEIVLARSYAETLKASFEKVTVTADDYEGRDG